MRKVFTIDRREIELFLELFLLVQYDFFESLSVLSDIIKVCRAMFLAYELVLLLQKRGARVKESVGVQAEIWIGVFAIYQFSVSVLSRSSGIVYLANYLMRMLLLVVCMHNHFRYSFQKTTDTIRKFFLLTIALNFLTVLLFREGITQTISKTGNLHENYLLGVDNQFGKIFFPGFAMIWFVDVLNRKKVSAATLLTMFSIVFVYFYKRNGTGSVLAVVLLLLVVCYQVPGLNRILSFKFLTVSFAILALGIFTSSGLIYQNSKFMSFVLRVIGKSRTFSGRIHIWASGVTKFLKKPFFGYGIMVNNASVAYRSTLYAAHNFFLQTALDGGVAGLALLLSPVLRTLWRAERLVLAHKEIRILYIGFLLTLLYSLMEVGSAISLLIMLFVLAYYIDRVSQTEKEETDAKELGGKKEFSV